MLPHMSKVSDSGQGRTKAPFSIAPALKCRGGCYSIPWIA